MTLGPFGKSGDGVPGPGGPILSISGNAPISVDNTDPANPVINYNELHELVTFTNDVNIFEFGDTINAINLAWTYNRNGDNPTSQSITPNTPGPDPLPVAVGLRAVALAAQGVVNTTIYTINAIGDDGNPSSLNTTLTRQAKVYNGVDQASDIDTGAEFVASIGLGSGVFDGNKAHTYNFDASVGGGNNYLYIAYPSAYGVVATSTLNGIAYNDYSVSPPTPLTNAVGGIQNYYILRSNNPTSGSDLEWVIT